MKNKILTSYLPSVLIIFLFSNLIPLQAKISDGTHIRRGVWGDPPNQYEFRDILFSEYLTYFPLESIREVLGDENFNKLNIDYWIHTSIIDVEMAMVERLDLTTVFLKNMIDFPLEDGPIGNNCWQSFTETGSVLFARNNAVVLITPENSNSFDAKKIEQSARKIDSVLIATEKVRRISQIPAPKISKSDITYYPKNWDDMVRIKIEATNPDNQNFYVRKYGTGYGLYSETGVLTTSLNKNTDSISDYPGIKIKVWVWNENHIVTSVEKEIYFMNYPGKFMLNKNDLPDCELIYTKDYSWLVGWNIGITGIQQRWKTTMTEGDEYIYIQYFEFENELKAISGTSYDAQSYSAPYYFGSPSGELNGNISFMGGHSAYSIQKWNIGVKIHAYSANSEEQRTKLLDISGKIQTKINDSIQTTYHTKDIELKKNQIQELEYKELSAKAIDLISEMGYLETKTDDTKWIYAADSLVMGLRKQFANEKSSFTIDIVRLANEADAEMVGQKRDTLSGAFSPFCQLANKDSMVQAFEKWPWVLSHPTAFFSTTGVIDNYAIFFHYQHEDSIDIDFFKSVLLAFSKNGTGIVDFKPENLKVYPNPAHETFTIELLNNEFTSAQLFNSTGKLLKILPLENGINTYNISELKSGIYFIRIHQKEGMVVKKLVKN